MGCGRRRSAAAGVLSVLADFLQGGGDDDGGQVVEATARVETARSVFADAYWEAVQTG